MIDLISPDFWEVYTWGDPDYPPRLTTWEAGANRWHGAIHQVGGYTAREFEFIANYPMSKFRPSLFSIRVEGDSSAWNNNSSWCVRFAQRKKQTAWAVGDVDIGSGFSNSICSVQGEPERDSPRITFAGGLTYGLFYDDDDNPTGVDSSNSDDVYLYILVSQSGVENAYITFLEFDVGPDLGPTNYWTNKVRTTETPR